MKIDLLVDGGKAFSCLLKRIRQARHSIYINMFIWRDDVIGNKMAKELLRAAERGVDIKISKDMLGYVFEKAEERRNSFFHKSFSWRLWPKHKLIEWFYPNIGRGSTRQHPSQLAEAMVAHPNISIEVRIKGDHSKFYIFDERYVILGGMNIEDRTIKGDVNGMIWNDYMVQIEGGVDNFKARLEGKPSHGPIEFIMNRKRFEIKPIILDLIAKAKKKIFIEMAYIGDKQVTQELIAAARRGIDIRFYMSYRTNVQPDFNLKVLKHIKDNVPVRVFLSRNMLHTKLILIDDAVTIGSTNINRQGLEKLSELNILTRDKGFCRMIERKLSARQKLCDEVDDIRYNKIRAFLESLI